MGGADAFPFMVRRVNRRQFLAWRFLRIFWTVLRLGRRADVVYANGLFLETALAAKLLRKRLVMKIVGDKAWEHWMSAVCKPFTMATIKYFDVHEIEQAWEWIETP